MELLIALAKVEAAGLVEELISSYPEGEGTDDAGEVETGPEDDAEL